MSKLFYSETGRVMHLVCEELSKRRHVRKVLRLPARVTTGGTLYLLGKARPGCVLPLRVRVNGRDFAVPPCEPPSYYWNWYALPLAADELRGGENVVELWSDNAAMDGWMLAISGSVENPASALSLDGGQHWQNERMSVQHCVRGEYIVRLRLDDPALADPAPPAMRWETPDHPQLAELRALVPEDIRAITAPWTRARALCSWVSRQFTCSWGDQLPYEHAEYCPWDALTILSWRQANYGEFQSNPIAFCVHYGFTLASFALALGMPARCVCCTGSLLEHKGGHFVSEVWLEEWHKWCCLDPIFDIAFVSGDIPWSYQEIATSTQAALLPYIDRGPGYAWHQAARHNNYEHHAISDTFALRAIWPRTDFFSHPELTPPSHGASYYAETDWLWIGDGQHDELGMFPCRISPSVVNAPPPTEWRVGGG